MAFLLSHLLGIIAFISTFLFVRSQLPFQNLNIPGQNGYNNPFFPYGTEPSDRGGPFFPQLQPSNPYQGNIPSSGLIPTSQYSARRSQLPYQNAPAQDQRNGLLPGLDRFRAIQQSVLTQREVVRAGFSVKNGSYFLEWEVTPPTITFHARRRGIGYVGFAISPSGGMSGADIFLAGVSSTGTPFANDYHHEYLPGGVGSAVPDVSNDYRVLEVSESNGYTSARFQRLLDTNDVAEDQKIENKVQNILWSIGPPSRELQYHGPSNRGVVRINLLDPPPKFRLKGSIL